MRPPVDEDRRKQRTLSDEDAEAIAEALLAKASDPEHQAKLVQVWGAYLDQLLGRGLRRVLWILVLGFSGFVAHKIGFWDSLARFFVGGKS